MCPLWGLCGQPESLGGERASDLEQTLKHAKELGISPGYTLEMWFLQVGQTRKKQLDWAPEQAAAGQME